MLKLTKVGSLLLCSLFLINGCSFFDNEDGIEKDRKEQLDEINGFLATYWKGAKIAFRSLPIDENTKTIDFKKIKEEQAKKLNLGKQLSEIYDNEAFLKDENKAEVETKSSRSAKEYLELAKEIYKLSDTIKSLDEDDYPTFVEVLGHSERVIHGRGMDIPENWNSSMDHWLFAVVMETRFSLGSWKTYELYKVDPDQMPTTDLKVIASLHKGLSRLRGKWYFLADEIFTKAIDETNKNGITLNDATKNLLADFDVESLSEEEKFRLLSRSSAHLLRGFSRHQANSSDLNDKALEDIEAAVKDFNKLGIENELVWLAESYVYVKNDEKEKAIASLTKLEKSKYLSSKEKTLIADAKKQIEKRDPESALNFITDKIIMCKIGYSYAESYAMEIEWAQLLEQTDSGRKILARFKELETIADKAKEYMSVDNWKDKAKGLLN